jgi:hypothetical protein
MNLTCMLCKEMALIVGKIINWSVFCWNTVAECIFGCFSLFVGFFGTLVSSNNKRLTGGPSFHEFLRVRYRGLAIRRR